MTRRELGRDAEPEEVTRARQQKDVDARRVADAELTTRNAAARYAFLKQHNTRVVIEVAGARFEATGDDLDAVVARANAHIRDLKQLAAEEQRQHAALSWGT